MNHSLNSLNGGYIRDYIGDTIRVIKGDTRSLDYGSYGSYKLQVVLGFRVSSFTSKWQNPKPSTLNELLSRLALWRDP